MKTQSATLASWRSQMSAGLFITAMAFWPLFTLLTFLEEEAELFRFRTSDAGLWVPLAGLALAAAISAPLFARLTPAKRCVAVALSVLGFAAAYGCCVLVGVHFLRWDD